MLISSRGRYALRLLTDMAEHTLEENDNIKLKDVAERQDISEKYLESIVQSLVKNDILVGSRGKCGGYRFAKSPSEITAFEVLAMTEGTLAAVSCQKPGSENCIRKAECRSTPLWEGLDRLIYDYLSGYTIADLAVIRDENGDRMV